MKWVMLIVFLVVFTLVSCLGFWAARWRSSNLNRIQEWGLAGRRFGIMMGWFLMGGDVYTAHVLIAIPGLVFARGAYGFYIIPYHILLWPIVYIFLPKFWILARHRGYITAGDFVRERFGSQLLALLVAITGLLATLPYIALQILGIEVVLTQMGIPIELSLIIAFLVLSAFTYLGGLRAPALMAMVKDIMVWLVIVIAVITISSKLGGLDQILAKVPKGMLMLPGDQFGAYATLSLGSALALFLYPHTLTGMLSMSSHKVVKRSAFLLPLNTILLGSLGTLGFMAIAAGVQSSKVYGANIAVPALFSAIFPPWFTGFAFAAITLGALIPASIMSIASANLFSRNIYRVYFRPSCTEEEEAMAAKLASLVAKFGALIFVLAFPTYTFANDLQTFGGVWILQTLPAVFLGLYTNWFHRYALTIGWVAGMVTGTWLSLSQNFGSTYPLHIGSITIPIYVALIAVLANLVLSYALTPLFRTLNVPAGRDLTTPIDYETHPLASQEFKFPETAMAHMQTQISPSLQPGELKQATLTSIPLAQSTQTGRALRGQEPQAPKDDQ